MPLFHHLEKKKVGKGDDGDYRDNGDDITDLSGLRGRVAKVKYPVQCLALRAQYLIRYYLRSSQVLPV